MDRTETAAAAGILVAILVAFVVELLLLFKKHASETGEGKK